MTYIEIILKFITNGKSDEEILKCIFHRIQIEIKIKIIEIVKPMRKSKTSSFVFL